MIYIVDTHALVWYVARDRRLSPIALRALSASESTLVVPTMVLAEIKHLQERGRIAHSPDEIMQVLEEDERCHIEDLTWSVVRLMPGSLDIHDAIIAATALWHQSESEEEVHLITGDRKIIEWGKVAVVW